MRKKFKDLLLSFAEKQLLKLEGQDLLNFTAHLLKKKQIISEPEIILLRRLLTFRGKDVRDIMVPREEIFALPASSQLKDVISLISQRGFSRIPVYEGSIDRILGILYVKDIAFYFSSDPEIKVRDLMREAHFVSETLKLGSLYREFTGRRVHIAMVCDEYGNVSGLVTMEDLLEEIFGEIEDEYDAPKEHEVVITESGSAIVLGKTNVDKLYELFGVKISVQGIDTINGLLSYLKNDIPQEGDAFEYKGLRFKVLKSDPKRALKVLISKAEGNTTGQV